MSGVELLRTGVGAASAGFFEDTLRVHVHRLRRKIEPTPAQPRYIVTERGVGYSFLAKH